MEKFNEKWRFEKPIVLSNGRKDVIQLIMQDKSDRNKNIAYELHIDKEESIDYKVTKVCEAVGVLYNRAMTKMEDK